MPRHTITTQFAFEDHNVSVLQRVNRGVRDFNKFVFSPAGAIAGAGLLAAGIAKVTSGYLANADALQKMSQRVGIGTAELGGLQFAFGQADLSAEDLQRTLSRLNQQGTEDIYEFADRISGIDDISERTAAAVDVLGDRLGPRLLTALNAGSEGLRQYVREHERLGLSIDQESAEAAARFNDNMDTITRVVEGAGNRVGMAIVNWSAPILEGIGTALGILPQSAEAQTQATLAEFINKLADARSTGLSLGEALTDPVLAQLNEMVRQAGIQTAAALAAADREVARRSAAATAAAYSERRLDILQDAALGTGEAIRSHRNLPIVPGTEDQYQSIQYDYDQLAGGGPREPAQRSDQRTYRSPRFALYGTAGEAGFQVGQGGLPAFAQGDPASQQAIADALAVAIDPFNAFANKEGAIIQTEAIRANQVVVEGPLDGGPGGRGSGGGGFGDALALINASKDDPVRVSLAGIGGLNDNSRFGRDRRNIEIRGESLFDKDVFANLVLEVIQDYVG